MVDVVNMLFLNDDAGLGCRLNRLERMKMLQIVHRYHHKR